MKHYTLLIMSFCMSLLGMAQNKTFKVGDVSFEMVFVEKGTFRMGVMPKHDLDGNYGSEEYATVTLSSFYIGKFEVTQALWTAVMGKYDDPSHHAGANRPVENVTWTDCQDFIAELNKITGQKFRLPTEAQWEFAARGGNKSKCYKYAGSDDMSKVCYVDRDAAKHKTYDVGSYLPNELGIYNMTGNVEEWCNDWYYNEYLDNSKKIDPQGPEMPDKRGQRSIRGGNGSMVSILGVRTASKPSMCDIFCGFRLVL